MGEPSPHCAALGEERPEASMNREIHPQLRILSILAMTLLGGASCVPGGSPPDESAPGEADEATAETAQALTHSCTLGVDCGNDQSGTVTTIASSGGKAAYKIRMTGYRRLDLFASVCNPSGWWLHLGDSPTNDGYGGDYGSTDHDAEAHMIDNALFYYSSWDMARFVAGNTLQSNGAYP